MTDRSTELKPREQALVTRMMDANFKASKTPYSYPPNMVEGMSAALRVAIEPFAQILEKYRVQHKLCVDLTGHPDAMRSQRIDWRCDACKMADPYLSPKSDTRKEDANDH